MRLLLDQGNSRLKWALVSEAGLFLMRGVSSADEFSPEFRARLSRAEDREKISGICLCTVASSERKQMLVEKVSGWLGMQPKVFAARAECAGLRNGYLDPGALGADRWLNLLGARSLVDEALLVVGAGTALTVDAVGRNGLHLGGFIVPGYGMQVAMLASGTARVGRSTVQPQAGWGRDTQAAVANGVLLSLVALIERASVELTLALKDTCRVVMTGGDSDLLASRLTCDPLVDPDLLFRGMQVELLESR